MRLSFYLVLCFIICFFMTPSFGADFEGTWHVDSIECNDLSNIKPGESPGMGFLPVIRCRDTFSTIRITYEENPENINVEFFDSYNHYAHKSFHCEPSSTFNFPKGICIGWNYWRYGELKLNNDGSIITHNEYKNATSRDRSSSYKYLFKLEKIDNHKYKLTRHMKYWLRFPGVIDVTQILYLSR